MSDKYTIENARQDTIDICKKEIESLQSQLKQKDEALKEANESIAFICRKLDEAKLAKESNVVIVVDSIFHKELKSYVEKYKVKEKHKEIK